MPAPGNYKFVRFIRLTFEAFSWALEQRHIAAGAFIGALTPGPQGSLSTEVKADISINPLLLARGAVSPFYTGTLNFFSGTGTLLLDFIFLLGLYTSRLYYTCFSGLYNCKLKNSSLACTPASLGSKLVRFTLFLCLKTKITFCLYFYNCNYNNNSWLVRSKT